MKKPLLSSVFCLTAFLLNAQSYNSCTDAFNSTSISEGTYSVGTINGDQPPTICSGGNGSNATAGEWIKYVPTQDYTVTVSSDLTVNGDKDTRLQIYTGVCGSLTCVAGDDDGGTFVGSNNSSYLSVASFAAYSGQAYYIVWDNNWNNSSDFDFSLTEDDFEAPPHTPITFTQQSISTSGSNRAVVDMNGDFLDDLVSISTSNININYQLPAGGFNSVNIATTPATYQPSWSLAAGDWDANGYNDLLYGDTNGVTFMKANADGTAFEQISGSQNIFSQRSNFVDIDNDGNLDAFVCHDVAPSVSFMNNGSGTLVYSNTNGLGNYSSGGNYGSVWIDFDNDGDIDMFMAKCGGNEARRTNQLYRNDGNGTYTEIGLSAGLADIIQTWSSAWGDYDNDGDMDVYVGSSTGYDHKIMRNNGDNTFTDVTDGANIGTAGIGHENVPGDFDNDGILDIYSNGSILFGNGDLTFNVNNDLTLPDIGSMGDFNNDGFLDFFYGSIYTNSTNANNWIKLVTIGNTEGGFSNKNGIGARVELGTSTGTQIRDVRSGEGFRFMHSLNTHFGIGTNTTIDYIKVSWPSGVVDIVLDPTINDTIVINEGSTLSTNGSTVTDLILYPNPTKTVLNLSTLENLDDAIYSVFDMNGRRVLNSKLTSNTIDVSGLSTGNYVLRLMFGNAIKSQKFIKQ
ncbi:MAG: FG-GAP-like repeat-containing protein [Aquaticitalea sp.]